MQSLEEVFVYFSLIIIINIILTAIENSFEFIVLIGLEIRNFNKWQTTERVKVGAVSFLVSKERESKDL